MFARVFNGLRARGAPLYGVAAVPTVTFQIPWAVLVMVVAGYLLVGIGDYGLLDNNEGLYAEGAREMLASGDFVIPRLNDVTYLEKPPLFYMLVAGVFAALGELESVARLVSVLAAVACLVGTMRFAAALGRDQAGRLAALMLGSSVGFVLMARVVMPDMLFTTLLNLALFSGYLALRQRNPRHLRASCVLLALAVLTKGWLACALFVLVFGVYVLLRPHAERRDLLRIFLDVPAWLLFVAVVAPWHVLAVLQDADFAWFYFVNEHILRFLGLREPRDYYTGSLFYYLPRILLFLCPWLIYLPLLLPRYRPADGDFDAESFLWAACLVPLAFFSLSIAKGNYYLLVAMPALALLIAFRLESLVAANQHRRPSLTFWVLMLGLAMVAVFSWEAKMAFLEPLPATAALANILVLAAFLAISAAGYLLVRRGRHSAGVIALSLLFAPFLGLLLYLLTVGEPYASSRPLANHLVTVCRDCPVFVYRDFERLSSLPFYLKHPVGIVDSDSKDLYFSQRRGEGKNIFTTTTEFLGRARRQPALLVVHDQRMVDFRQSPIAIEAEPLTKIGYVSVFRLAATERGGR